MRRKIYSCIIIFAMMFSFCSSTLAVTTKELKQKQNELKQEKKEVTAEKSEAISQINTIENKISDLDSEIAKIKEEIEDLNADIDKKEKEINSKNKDIEEKEELLQKRLVAMYKAGDTSYLDFILNGNIIDYMSNYYLINQIAEFDSDLIDDITEEKDKLVSDKDDIKKDKEKLETKKKALNEKNSSLESEKNKKEKTVSNLTAEEKDLQKKIDAYYAQERALEASLRAAERNTINSNLVFTANGLKWPCPYTTRITSYFGSREQPLPGASTYHKGIDIAASGIEGKPVVSAADGQVTFAGWNGYGGGNVVQIYHGSGMTTVYMHLKSISVSVGQSVKASQQIATVGNTGNSTGAHLHFGVKINGTYVNPLNYF